MITATNDVHPPLISILSPIYNEEEHLREMVSSVQTQRYSHWELILVDDGSTDGTADLARLMQKQDGRIKLASHGVKLGKARAFNVAFQASRGEVIVMLGGDDRLPLSSLYERARDLGPYTSRAALGMYKIRTFSTDPRYDGMLLPRGRGTSASGGSLTMTRKLAEKLFPIPNSLPSEDIWLGYSAPRVAEVTIKSNSVVLDYRIHPGNSNPRHLDYSGMRERIAPRHEAWRLLAESQLPFPPQERNVLNALYAAELARRQENCVEILKMHELPLATRFGLMAMGNPYLYRARKRLYAVLSGWRRE